MLKTFSSKKKMIIISAHHCKNQYTAFVSLRFSNYYTYACMQIAFINKKNITYVVTYIQKKKLDIFYNHINSFKYINKFRISIKYVSGAHILNVNRMVL